MALIVDRRGAETWVWDLDALDWVRAEQAGAASGGPSAIVEVSNFPATQAVSGPYTLGVASADASVPVVIAGDNGPLNVVYDAEFTGQTDALNSVPVVIASDQTPLPVAPLQLSYASGSVSSSGNNTLITPTLGNKLRLYYASYNPSAAVEVAFRFGAAGTLFMRNNIVAGGSIVAKDLGDFRYLQGATNEALFLNLSGAVATIWNVFYVEVT